MNNLKTIESALQRLEELYDINREVMDADDYGDLQVIAALKHVTERPSCGWLQTSR